MRRTFLHRPTSPGDAPPGAARAGARLVVALAVACVNAWILIHFHDQFWWAPDEGNYAHVAERVLDGEVLHADVQDIHPGYVNFANAGALGLFGRRLVSMRYPLVALGLAQSAIIFVLLLPFGAVAAAIGSTTITALGFVQFLDPTAHWYALFLVILVAGVLQLPRAHARWRLDAVGAIVMTAVLLRQLSGVFIAMGAVTYLLLEGSRGVHDEGARDGGVPVIARGIGVVMLAGLVAYLVRGTEQVGWLLFGIWPVLLLVWTIRATGVGNRDALTMTGRLARGAAVAALPLVAYHAMHGSLRAWYEDAVVTAVQFPRMPFFDAMNYGTNLAGALGVMTSEGAQGFINGVFWIALTLVAATLGALLLARLARPGAGGANPAPPALPILAVFYAAVSVHYQIPIYLTYTAGLSLVALICLTRGSPTVIAAAAVLSAVGLHFHAGQPLSRGLGGATEGARAELVAEPRLERVGLRIEPADAALYGRVIALIHREVPPTSSIFAVPSHAELYFLADRRNPFRFFNSALGVRTPDDLAGVLATIERDPPVLIFHNRRDKYNTAESRAIMDRVSATYEALPSMGPFEVYRRRAGPVAAAPGAQSSRE